MGVNNEEMFAHPATFFIPTELAVRASVALKFAGDACLVLTVKLSFLVAFC